MTPLPKCSVQWSTSSKTSTIASVFIPLSAICRQWSLKPRFRYKSNLNCLRHFWGALHLEELDAGVQPGLLKNPPVFKEAVVHLAKLQLNEMLGITRGRPEESAVEFLNKLASKVLQLGVDKPLQTAVAELLGCEPRHLRGRQKKHGFKNWADTVTAIRKHIEEL